MFQYENVNWSEAELSETEVKNNGLPPGFIWVCKWFMHGLNGPFGSVSTLSSSFRSKILKSDKTNNIHLQKNKIKNNLIPNGSSTAFRQEDQYNCGVCCFMFMYDLITGQHPNSWRVPLADDGILPPQIILGNSVLNKKFMGRDPGFVMQDH